MTFNSWTKASKTGMTLTNNQDVVLKGLSLAIRGLGRGATTEDVKIYTTNIIDNRNVGRALLALRRRGLVSGGSDQGRFWQLTAEGLERAM